MLASRRVHPASYEKPAPTEPTGRPNAYQVGEENDDDAVLTDMAEKVEVVSKRRDILSRSFLLAFMIFLCFMSITTFVLTALMISGIIGNRCNCSDVVEGNQQRQGSVLSCLMDNHCYRFISIV